MEQFCFDNPSCKSAPLSNIFTNCKAIFIVVIIFDAVFFGQVLQSAVNVISIATKGWDLQIKVRTEVTVHFWRTPGFPGPHVSINGMSEGPLCLQNSTCYEKTLPPSTLLSLPSSSSSFSLSLSQTTSIKSIHFNLH